jgi:hypothetical protein
VRLNRERALETQDPHRGVRIASKIAEREAEGYRIVQQGRVLRPYAGAGDTFADRVEDCRIALIKSGDVLLDDDERWVHMQRKTDAA